jgi:mycothiol system anti-sigma-R factor
MSRREPHEGHYECSDVVYRIFEYLDGEMDARGMELVAEHLQECGPCLAEHDLDAALKALVRRSCHEEAPAHLRVRIVHRITRVRGELDG